MTVMPEENADCSGKRWYRGEDYAHFRHEFVQDVLRARSQGELDECVGIETFLNRNFIRKMTEKKRAHTNAILTGQNVCNVEELSSLSEKSSRWARDGAHSRATIFYDSSYLRE